MICPAFTCNGQIKAWPTSVDGDNGWQTLGKISNREILVLFGRQMLREKKDQKHSLSLYQGEKALLSCSLKNYSFPFLPNKPQKRYGNSILQHLASW